jgi:hypothetical protein
MKIWELHGQRLKGIIRSTPDGDAEVAGLILSEKAYLLAVRDFRPTELAELILKDGPTTAARSLIEHYSRPESLQVTGGRGLALARNGASDPILRRSDEIEEMQPAGHRA